MILYFCIQKTVMRHPLPSRAGKTASRRPELPGRAALAALSLLAALTGACSKDQAPPAPAPQTSTTPPAPSKPLAQQPAAPETTHAPQRAARLDRGQETALMAAIFAAGVPREHGAVLAEAGTGEDAGLYLMTLLSAKELPDGRIAVVVNGTAADEEGMDRSGHGTGGKLNVYMARYEGDAWRVLSRRENITELGSNGTMGAIEWVDVAPGKPGFVVRSGGVWQGYSIEGADIFDLDGGVRALGDFMLASSSSGACSPDSDTCWDIEGHMRFVDAAGAKAYSDILVEFIGKRYTVSEDAKGKETEHLVDKIRQTARYRFDGKGYVLVSGTNPAAENGI